MLNGSVFQAQYGNTNKGEDDTAFHHRRESEPIFVSVTVLFGCSKELKGQGSKVCLLVCLLNCQNQLE